MAQLINKLVQLIQIAYHSKPERMGSISALQDIVWNLENDIADIKIKQIFLDLAYDLDYYEPDSTARKEDTSYYGDERLEQELMDALSKLKEVGVSVPDAE